MSFRYFTDREYEQAFVEFGNIRSKIAEKMKQLTLLEGGTILDFLSGHGFLSAEMAIRFPKSRLLGIGLRNDVETWERFKNSKKHMQSVWLNFHYLLSDATRIPLKASSCNMVVNFLGLEDLNMTSGWRGVQQAFSEIERITKRDALIQISLVEYGKTPEEVLAKEIWSTIGLNAVFRNQEDYLQLFEDIGIHPIETLKFKLRRKMTAKQAREELRFACEEAPRIFSTFNIRAIKFEDLWERFGERIEADGLAYWPQIKVIILSKE
ncbi:MAG: methyltransferase domain-containing protein [Candidatus Thorarchaeota archaeon]